MEKWCPQRRPELQSTPRRLKGMSYDFVDTLCSRGHGGTSLGYGNSWIRGYQLSWGCVGVRVHGEMTELQKGKEGRSSTGRKWSIQVESIKLGGLSSAEARRRYFVVSLLLLHAVSLKSLFSHQGRETSVYFSTDTS